MSALGRSRHVGHVRFTAVRALRFFDKPIFAAKKYSAIHFMKRRNFVNNCVAQHAKASAPKAKSTTTGQAPKQAQ